MNIHVKLSGFHYVDTVAWDFPYPRCRPVVRALYEHFGPERLHWGSDYPVCCLTASLTRAVAATRDLVAGCSESEMARLFHRNAERLYRVQAA